MCLASKYYPSRAQHEDEGLRGQFWGLASMTLMLKSHWLLQTCLSVAIIEELWLRFHHRHSLQPHWLRLCWCNKDLIHDERRTQKVIYELSESPGLRAAKNHRMHFVHIYQNSIVLHCLALRMRTESQSLIRYTISTLSISF